MARLIRIDRNGTKYYEGNVPCSRCDGKGVYIIGVNNGQPVLSPVDQGICFKCGGSKVEWKKWKEYTPEYEAKLEERRRKRREKLEAEQEEERAKQEAWEEKKRQAKEAERKAEEERIREEKAKSNFIGSIGEKIELKAIYVGTAFYERTSYAGFGTERVNIHMFKDFFGNKIIWKTTASLGRWGDNDEWKPCYEGHSYLLKGTVKEHTEYKEEKQTILKRCKVDNY